MCLETQGTIRNGNDIWKRDIEDDPYKSRGEREKYDSGK